MTKIIRFYKKNEKWYVDVNRSGCNVDECKMSDEMVDFFLHHTDDEDDELFVEFSDEEPLVCEYLDFFVFANYDTNGAKYDLYLDHLKQSQIVVVPKAITNSFEHFPKQLFVLNAFSTKENAIENQQEELDMFAERCAELKSEIEDLKQMFDLKSC